jgi:hypothetical protein
MSNVSTVSPSETASAMVVASGDDTLPLRAAAKEAKVSESTLRRLVQEGAIEAIRDAGGTMRVTQATIIELKTRGALKRGPNLSVVAQEEREGERDARVFAALETGRTITEVIVSERIPARVAISLRQTWLLARQTDRQGIEFACSCGAASDPRTARCARCFERTRVLTDAQQATLAGTELPPPGACTCRGCGSHARVEDVDALCATCAPKLTVVERGGVLAVVLAGKTVRELSVAETRDVVRHLGHHLPPSKESAT